MARRYRNTASISTLPSAFRPLIQLWICRLMARAGGLRVAAEPGREARELLASAGIQAPARSKAAEFAEAHPSMLLAALRERLERRLEHLEARGASLPARCAIRGNLDRLGASLGLNAIELDLMAFLVLIHEDSALEGAVDAMGNMTDTRLQAVLAMALGQPIRGIQEALRQKGALVRSGLVRIERQNRWGFTSKVELLDGLCEALLNRHREPFDVFKSCFVAARAPELRLEDYSHFTDDLEILVPFLRQACARGQKGVNVLLHGVPGTGKTQLALALAQAVGAEMHEVASENPDGSPIQGESRIRAFRLAQAVLGRGRGRLLLFDEVEDVFRSALERESQPRANRSGMKAWLNRILEENPVPAIWITNSTELMDHAVLRRFDYIMEVRVPPRRVRARILESAAAGLPLDPAWKEAMSAHEGLAPAIVSRVARVVRLAHDEAPGLDTGRAFPRALANHLEVIGQPAEPRNLPDQPTRYRLDLIQADCDMAALIEGLRRSPRASLCLYGPPGTGKTAFGRHLAEILGRNLHVKRASDLLGMFVGQTEHALARMFREAFEDQAVLLLDEADGFLRDRRGARQSWEVSQVNEMLTQMESFKGVFVASTNLMDTLDPAAMRRFDQKVKFGYLGQDQIWRLIQDAAEDLGLEIPGATEFQGLHRLTPGDMATVLRQGRFRPIASMQDLLSRLRQECAHKPEGVRRAIGF